MDENLKKPKRPRIGEANANPEENLENGRYEKVEYTGHHPNAGEETAAPEGYQQQEGYQPRQQGGYHRQGYQPRQQGGYQPRQQGGYQPRYQQRQGGYQPRYQQRYQQPQAAGEQDPNAEGNTMTPEQQGGYQPRQQGYQQRQGGYQQRQGGYQPRQGGYQQRQGGYQQRQGGYQQRGQGGYQQRGQGGYQQRPKRQGPKPQMRFTPKPQRVIYDEPVIDPNMEVRLNKFMANAGICSRRVADEYIQKGLVMVNDVVVTELGMKITPKDVVKYNGEVVTTEKKCYILLNKPKDCVTTSDDPNGRKTVIDLVKGACEERIYPVGRLDRNTTGVLLLTNDGDLAAKLAHPQYVKKKIYQVWTDKPISEEDMQHIADGVELDDGPIHADAVSQAGIEIHSGRNRIVRRIFEALGYHVVKLDRVYFAGLTKKNLPRGRWRYLTQEEVNFLKQNSFE